MPGIALARPSGDAAFLNRLERLRCCEYVTCFSLNQTMATYPDDADGAVLADLAERGVDMSQPLVIEFPVIAPDEAAAKGIGDALAKAGYEPEVVYDEGEPDENGEIDPNDPEFGPAWTVFVTLQIVPEYKEIIRIQEELDQLARPFGGSSDGWGVLLDDEEE